MTNVEIYDSSNSQLSSDEYSNDEDDDALMDVAVSKQTPPKSEPKSTEASPNKADSAATPPRKLSDDLDAIAGSSTKPPASREVTQRQIKQMQRNNQANLYFKRRSIRWLQRLYKKMDYLSDLKTLLPAREAEAKKIAKRRAKKHLEMLAKMAKRNERTPSRSRSRSRSQSSASVSDVVCLDDTENEDSPEKITENAAAHQFVQSVQNLQVVKNPCSPYNLKLELGAGAVETADENNILDEFLTMKPAVKAAEPIVQTSVLVNDIKKQQQQQEQHQVAQEQLPLQLIDEPAACNIEAPMEEVTHKRKRSISPPVAEPKSDKRTKPIMTDVFDDDIIEFLPLQPTQVKQPTPPPAQQQQPQQPPPQQQQPITTPTTTPMHKPAVPVPTLRPNIDTSNIPAFKLGPPFSLQPTSGIDFHAQKKAQQQQMQSATSYSLETPTPPVEPMEIVYPTPKAPLPHRERIKTAPAANTPSAVVQQQAPQDSFTFATPQQPMPQQQQQQQQHHYQQQQPIVSVQKPKPKQTPVAAAAAVAASGSSTPAASATHNKTNPTEVNNSNSNTNFHQRIKDTYTEFDDIMTERVNAITPELMAMRQEQKRNNADIETLNKLLGQKEEEWNRLQHLLCVKKELAKRLERKSRILIMKEVLPPILSRHCSTSELYELDSLLYKEKNAPVPSRFGSNAIDKLIVGVATDQEDVRLLKGFLGMPDTYPGGIKASVPPPPPPQSYYGSQLQRHNSVPAMRPPMPATTVDRSATYRRHSDYHFDNYAERQTESLPPKSSKLQSQPQSRYQQLINESKELVKSAPDANASSSSTSATTSYRSRQQQQQPSNHTVDTHRRQSTSLGNESTLKPLYNSSPLGVSKPPHNQRNDTQPQINDQHSTYRNMNNTNRSNRLPNGPQELNPECQHCGRPNANLLCANCKNRWYCNRECQLRAWDAEHWQSCIN